MSLFTALNFTPNDALLEAEEHSRELQIEESFKVFQNALLHLKAKRFTQAGEKFEQLFNIDVIKPDRWGVYRYASHTLDSLRYLAYRNRGVFYYQYLKENYENMSSEDIVDHILKVIENLLEAIQHGGCDSAVTELLFQIFKSFKSKKLQRWVLEYELSKEAESTGSLGYFKSVLPQVKRLINEQKLLLTDIKDDDSIKAEFLSSLLGFIKNKNLQPTVLNPVLSKIRDMKTEDENAMRQLNEFEVELEEISWEAIAQSLKELLPKFKTAALFSKASDPYSEVEEPIESVRLIYAEKSRILREEEVGQEATENQKEAAPNKNDEIDDGISPTPTVMNTNKRVPDLSDNQKPAQRSSKRFKERDQDVGESEILAVHSAFFEKINDAWKLVDLYTDFDINKMAPEELSQDSPIFTAITDLYDCLSSWTNRHSEFLNQNDSKNNLRNNSSGKNVEDLVQLNTLLRTNMFNDDNIPTKSLTDIPVENIESFINEVNSHRVHFQEVRFHLLQILLSTNQDEVCLITDTFWSTVLFNIIESFVLGLENSIYNLVYAHQSKHKDLGLSVYEILVNMMGGLCNDINTKRLQGQKVGEMETQKNKLERKITRWSVLLDAIDGFTERNQLRYMWSNFCFLQCISEITDDNLITSLNKVQSRINKTETGIEILYSNYKNIPRLHLKTVESQLSKISMVRKFTILDLSEADESSTLEHMETLRRVLTDESSPGDNVLDEEERSMVEFISQSPFLLKLKLWKILLVFYASVEDQWKFQNCYFKVLSLLYERLCSGDYFEQSQLQRQQTLLTTLSSIGMFTSEFLKFLSEKSLWKLPDTEASHTHLTLITKILFLFYPILFYESMCQKDSSLKSFFKKAVKSSAKLKNILANLFSLAALYFNSECAKRASEYEESATVGVIWSLHSLMGRFKFCDSAGGNFLRLAEHLLCGFGGEHSFLQLKQTLWCRYHFLLGGDSFSPEQHDTSAVEMQRSNAVLLGTYLINFQYQGKNPLLISGSKTNFKQILDNITEVIGEPNYSENHILARNSYFFDQYFESPITTRLIHDAFFGCLELKLSCPNDKLQGVIDSGLFYVSSVQSMNLYKVRKKSMQARPSELDSIISMLRADLLYNTKRFESWYLLGRCYSYMVEDDLIWTSDKLSTLEKKKGTAYTQRKAILCYLMSVGTFLAQRENKDIQEDVDNNLILKKVLEALGVETLNGYLKPMHKLCFQWRTSNDLRLNENNELFQVPIVDKPSITEHNVEQAIFLALQRADEITQAIIPSRKTVTRNWQNLYFMAKLQFKTCIEDFKNSGMEMVIDACRVAAASSKSGDPIIEPHYFLVDSCYKCQRLGLISEEEALEIILKDNDFFQQDDSFWKITDVGMNENKQKCFSKKIIELLKKILSSDKKKWHHRPKYRIARILFEDLDELDGAISEMDSLMVLKSTNKNLVNIWKPEFERPGKHFIYTYQYVMFYMDLLFYKNDYVSIGWVAKKLRRFGSGMVNIAEATERAVTLYCQSVQNKLQINEKEYAEQLLPSLNYQNFLKNSEELFNTFDKSTYQSEIMDALSVAYQLKKGSISYDAICLAIYFKYFYLPFAESKTLQETEQAKVIEFSENGSPHPSTNVTTTSKTSSSRKRVSKRDAFDRIAALVEKKIT